MNLTGTTALTAAAVMLLFLLLIQAAHPVSFHSTSVSPVAYQHDDLSQGANTTAPNAINQLVFSAVGVVVAILSAAGLAVVIRRGNFL